MSESYDSAAFLLRQIPDLPDGVLHFDYIDFESIVCNRHWSDGEWALIIAAQDLWNGAGKCTLRQVIANLDDANFAALIEALQLRRPSAFTSNLVTR